MGGGAGAAQVGGQGDTDYECPAPEGHFPDVDKCHVYYQCANGIATRQSCGAGLKWVGLYNQIQHLVSRGTTCWHVVFRYNVLTNQCDWKASVDCSLNSDPRMLNQHVGPTPRPQLTALQQQQNSFQESNSFGQQLFNQQGFDPQQFEGQQAAVPFSKFFRVWSKPENLLCLPTSWKEAAGKAKLARSFGWPDF